MIGRLLFFYVGIDFISVSELSCEKNGRVLAEAHRGTLRLKVVKLNALSAALPVLDRPAGAQIPAGMASDA
jgi:hypothetical protein